MNLTAEQHKAHAAAYRNVHHTRIYRLHTRADGGVVLVVRSEHDDALIRRFCKAVLHGNAVTIEYFTPGVSEHYRGADHLASCITATLNAYAHAGRPVAEAFDFVGVEQPCSSSLPMVIPEMLASAH